MIKIEDCIGKHVIVRRKCDGRVGIAGVALVTPQRTAWLAYTDLPIWGFSEWMSMDDEVLEVIGPLSEKFSQMMVRLGGEMP